MKVFKFGGASVKDADSVRNVASILQDYKADKLLIVVSAMGKNTNALELVTESHFNDWADKASYIETIKDFHTHICNELFPGNPVLQECVKELEQIPALVEKHKERGYDFVYDQVVSLGEYLSTKIVAAFLNTQGLPTAWVDAIDCVMTDDTYREGSIQWQETKTAVRKVCNKHFEEKNFILTQGFTGRDPEGFTTTLGREGSDYTAAIFSFCLNAEYMAVWKDVPGILNADPRKFTQVTKIDRLSYKEAIEMTYFGAKVIHPKTIKPLQNKSIPLHVKSFVEPEGAGTIISSAEVSEYPPVVVLEPKQTLIRISTRDFSFVAEHHLSELFAMFAEYRIKVNMMRNTAISFSVCVTHRSERLAALMKKLDDRFNLITTEGLELITVRHHNEEVVENLKKGKIVLMEEKLPHTMRMVVKDVPVPIRKV